MTRLAGRVALVTGMTGEIGAAIAARLAAEGATVVGCGRTTATGERAAEAIRAAGGDATFVVADLTDEADVVAAVDHAVDARGGIDVVVNAVGGAGDVRRGFDGTVVAVGDDALDRFVAVGLTATVLLCRHAVPAMIRSGGGSLVHVSSVATVHPFRGMAAYTAVKAGVEALSRQLALDHAADGIRSNCLLVGPIRTADSARAHDDPVTGPRYRAMVLTPRLGAPADVAAAAAFLASDDAAFVTGALLPVDGGASIRGNAPDPVAAYAGTR